MNKIVARSELQRWPKMKGISEYTGKGTRVEPTGRGKMKKKSARQLRRSRGKKGCLRGDWGARRVTRYERRTWTVNMKASGSSRGGKNGKGRQIGFDDATMFSLRKGWKT